MQAIQTSYKGYLFRSRLEARWAVFFDALCLKWEYEKEGYDLPGGKYLPDFWLPEMECWCEVKPVGPTPQERMLAEDLGNETDRVVVFLIGTPPGKLMVWCSDSTDGSGGTQWWGEFDESPHFAIGRDGCPCVCMENDHSSRSFSTPEWEGPCPSLVLTRECQHDDPGTDWIIEQAITAARSARFEHGQSGPTL